MTTASRKNNIAMKAWPTNHYDCNGDYRNEMHLESLIGGPLYDSQNDLPKLPIPSVKETIDRLLPTALPLAKTKQEEVELNVACKQFEKQSQQLHERLIHRRENEMNDSSFLQQWWNQVSWMCIASNLGMHGTFVKHFHLLRLFQLGYLQVSESLILRIESF
jgi:carnitine O-acetyltransferase